MKNNKPPLSTGYKKIKIKMPKIPKGYLVETNQSTAIYTAIVQASW